MFLQSPPPSEHIFVNMAARAQTDLLGGQHTGPALEPVLLSSGGDTRVAPRGRLGEILLCLEEEEPGPRRPGARLPGSPSAPLAAGLQPCGIGSRRPESHNRR